jgi:transposase-like protein
MITKENKMNSTESKGKRALIQHSAEEKCRAVLSVWSERRKASAVCKELGIQPALLTHWQERAMEAMLRALEPKTHSGQSLPALGPRLQKLLLRRVLKREGKVARLRERLERIQQPTKPQAKPS